MLVAVLGTLGVLAVLAGVVYLYLKNYLNPKFNFKPITSGYVVVTGSSTGIGADAVVYLASKGFKVFACVRDAKHIEGLQKRLQEKGGDGEILELLLDVTRQDLINSAVQRVTSIVQDQGLVGLVNNAGIHTDGPVEFQPMKDIRWQFEVNVFGQIAVIQAFMPLLRKARGRIINMSSVAGFLAAPFEGAYAGSKHALEAISDALRLELYPWRMSVSVIEPGFIGTELIGKAINDHTKALKDMPQEAQKYYGPRYEDVRRIPPKLTGDVVLTSRAIHHALTSSSPKTRYVVGSPAFLKMIQGSQLVPDRFLDRAVGQKTWPRKYTIADAESK